LNILGIETRLRDSGGDGPVLLLSSGVGHSLEFWEPQFEACAQDYRVVAWDYPAHGLSDLGSEHFTVTSLAKHALALLDALGIQTATFVGNSLGGAVSVMAHNLASHRVDALILVAPALHGPEAVTPFKLFSLPVIGKLMSKPSDALVDRQISGIFHPSFTVSEALRAVIRRNVFKEGAAASFLNIMKSTLTLRGVKPAIYKEMHQILTSTECPVLFIHGQDDLILPCSQSRENVKRARRGQLEIFENCGHIPQLEKPNKFNELIRKFVPVG